MRIINIVVIYGNERKGSTYNCVNIIKNNIKSYGDISFEEIHLTKDLPNNCIGCFNCINKGEKYCPHNETVSSILNSILEADGVILASPVYGLDVSGAMKNLIDHLCFMWMPHRPKKEIFSKIGFVVSTSAGAGTKRTNKTMKTALNYMGFNRTYSFGIPVAASSWDDVKEKKKIKIEKILRKKSRKYYNSLLSRDRLGNRLFTKVLFSMMKGMTKGFPDGHIDKEYWRSMGWYGKAKPY
ncbi:MAG: flavodoxin family protein [Clostridiaceae bacterium]